jgi:hypothetical protein
METPNGPYIENKGVPRCKQIRTLQFPTGDDVSALHPLRSSVGVLVLGIGSPRYEFGNAHKQTPTAGSRPNESFTCNQTMQIEHECFIIQGRPENGFYLACSDLKPDRQLVVNVGLEQHPSDAKTRAVGIPALARMLSALTMIPFDPTLKNVCATSHCFSSERRVAIPRCSRVTFHSPDANPNTRHEAYESMPLFNGITILSYVPSARRDA